jgi:hypothetical protein
MRGNRKEALRDAPTYVNLIQNHDKHYRFHAAHIHTRKRRARPLKTARRAREQVEIALSGEMTLVFKVDFYADLNNDGKHNVLDLIICATI